MEEWSSINNYTLANDSFATVPHHHHLLFHNYPDSLLNFAVAACVIFILVGIPGNLITIIALVRYGKIRSATAIFIINLSVSDLMFCCFNLPLATSLFYHRDWVHGDVLCQLFPLLRYGLLAVSIFTILAITLNRYVMIGHPRWYPKLYKRRHLWIMIALTWVGCFGSLIPTLLGQWGKFGLDYGIGSCSILPDETSHKSPKEFLFVVAFMLPCVAIVVCYARIFFIVRKAAAASRGKGPGGAAGHTGALPDGSGGAGGNGNGGSHQRAKSGTTRLCPPTPGTKEASSFNLTCCESQQASGSTDTSDESQPPVTPCHQRRPSTEQILHNKKPSITLLQAPAKSATILRWKGTKKSSVRIEVDHGSVLDDDRDPAAGELLQQSSSQSGAWDASRLSIPDIRIETASISSASGGTRSHRSLSFDFGGGNGSNGSGSSNTGKTQLLTASLGRQTPPSRSVSPTPTELSSPVSTHSVDSHNYSRRGPECGISNATQPMNLALAHVTNVLTRRSTRAKRALHAGRMTPKDRKLLQMILVIFISFVVCYMPITIVKLMSKETDLRILNILSYVLIYLTTSINPIIYVAMSSEYRQAYKNLLTCKMASHTSEAAVLGNNRPGISRSMSQKA